MDLMMKKMFLNFYAMLIDFYLDMMIILKKIMPYFIFFYLDLFGLFSNNIFFCLIIYLITHFYGKIIYNMFNNIYINIINLIIR